MLWVGITGSIGTGKSTFSGLLRKQGHVVLDADELARQMLEPTGSAYKKVVAEFGPELLDKNGHMDRAALAKIVFSDKAKLEKLESIIHPEIRFYIEKSKDEHAKKSHKYLFYDVPLLFEKNMEKTFDLVVMVTCSPEVQMQRIKSRNSWSDDEINKRISAQLPLAEKESKAHVLINNDGDLIQLEEESRKFILWLEAIQNQD